MGSTMVRTNRLASVLVFGHGMRTLVEKSRQETQSAKRDCDNGNQNTGEEQIHIDVLNGGSHRCAFVTTQ